MDSKKYTEWAKTLDRTSEGYNELAIDMIDNSEKLRWMHHALGMAGETGEVVDLVKKSVMYNTDLNVDKVKMEVGDVLWYMSNLLHSIDSSFEEVMQMNYEKLSKRYPTGSFSEKDATERKDMK